LRAEQRPGNLCSQTGCTRANACFRPSLSADSSHGEERRRQESRRIRRHFRRDVAIFLFPRHAWVAIQGPATFQAPDPPAWGMRKITTSHLFGDAPRDDVYCWRGEGGDDSFNITTRPALGRNRCRVVWVEDAARNPTTPLPGYQPSAGQPSQRGLVFLQRSLPRCTSMAWNWLNMGTSWGRASMNSSCNSK